jgi:hypothetical protein
LFLLYFGRCIAKKSDPFLRDGNRISISGLRLPTNCKTKVWASDGGSSLLSALSSIQSKRHGKSRIPLVEGNMGKYISGMMQGAFFFALSFMTPIDGCWDIAAKTRLVSPLAHNFYLVGYSSIQYTVWI